MEWEPEGRDAWVLDAERWIGQIRGVQQCKMDIDSDGEITGIHVVAGMDREPRHIVRDVEGLLKARLGLSVYYKKIGVVQVVDRDGEENAVDAPTARPVTIAKIAGSVSAEAPPATTTGEVRVGPVSGTAAVDPPDSPDVAEDAIEAEGIGAIPVEALAAEALTVADSPDEDLAATSAVLLAEDLTPRLQCSGVGMMASDQLVRAEVELQAGTVEARGSEEAPNHAESDMNVIARATVDAVRQLLDDPVLLNLSEVKMSTIGGQSVVMVAVELVEGRKSERLVGTCPTSHNRQQAVVYAVLDALNRRLSLMTLKAEEAIN